MTMLEDRLRTHLETVAAQIASPPLDPGFPARRARRRRQNRLAAAAAAVVITIGGIGTALAATTGDEESRTQVVDQPEVTADVEPPSTDPVPPTVSVPSSESSQPGDTTVDVASPPAEEPPPPPEMIDVSGTVSVVDYGAESVSGVSAGAGAIWAVSIADDRLPDVVRLDPETGEIVARIGLRALGVVAGPDAVWVPATDGSLHRVDPATNAVVASVPVVENDPNWFGSGDANADGVWLSPLLDPKGEPFGRERVFEATRVDPATDSVTAVVSVPEPGWFGPVAVTDDAVWVGSGRMVHRIDPETNEVVASVVMPNSADVGDVVADGDTVWIIGSGPPCWTCSTPRPPNHLAARVNTAANEVVATVELTVASQAVLVDGHLLVGSPGGRTVSRINTSSNKLEATINVGRAGPSTRHLTVADGTLWFNDQTQWGEPAAESSGIGYVPLDVVLAAPN